MPGYRGHIAGALIFYGIFIYLAAWHLKSTPVLIEWLAFMLAGALFPDIDTKSKGQHFFYTALFIVLCTLAFYKKYIEVAIGGIIACIPLLVRHRGIFHNFWFLLCLITGTALILIQAAPQYGTIIAWDAGFFLLGATSHLFFDRRFKMFR